MNIAKPIVIFKEEKPDTDYEEKESQNAKCLREALETKAEMKEEPINFVECDVEIKQEPVFDTIEEETKIKNKESKNDGDSNELQLSDETSTDSQEHSPEKNNSLEKRFKCNECDFSTAYKSVMTVHCRMHTGERPFKCKECKAGFTHSSALKVHVRIHTGEKPFKCNECGFSAARRSALNIHKNIHTGIKPFACDQCDFTTATRANLLVHKRKHTGEKPYACTLCPYRAGDISSFKRHGLLHSGLRPHKCEFCDYCTKRKEYLVNHLKRHTR